MSFIMAKPICSSKLFRGLVFNLRNSRPIYSTSTPRNGWISQSRANQTLNNASHSSTPDFAFAFDIDGVLLRSQDPIAKAHEALAHLQSQKIPFIFLTNGGGKHESERVEELSQKLKIPLDISMFIQSHTPFAELDQYKDKTILVVGGDGDGCRQVAERYGFKSVVTPADILVQHPSIWPFSHPFLSYYQSFARPLPQPIDLDDPSKSLKIEAIFVYNDSRDWGLDASVILDLLLSKSGIMGTPSSKNNDPSLPNLGYHQDGQPPLYFSNPDLWWAAKYHLPRLGQGAFRESLEGLWTAATGGKKNGVLLKKEVIGKPYFMTYDFAEKILLRHRAALFGKHSLKDLRNVYMIGDNPESDIRGGNSFDSPRGVKWSTILVRTGVYRDGPPTWEPTAVANDVYDAINWALQRESHKPVNGTV